MATRDADQDESLGLNCAWYADILLTPLEATRIRLVSDRTYLDAHSTPSSDR